MSICISNHNRPNNRYDYMIMSVIFTLVAGNLGGALQPIRLIGLFSLPFVLTFIYNNKLRFRNILCFFILCFFYSLISLFWTSDINEAFKEFFYYLVHISLFFFLVYLSFNSNCPYHSIIKGWLIAFLFSAIIAICEILFDIHLPMNIYESDLLLNSGGTVMQKQYASVTFGNYNGYVTFLCCVLPFLFAYILTAVKIRCLLYGWLAFMLMAYILLINASRGGLLSLLICFLAFLFFFKRTNIKYKKIIFLILISFICYVIYVYSDILLLQIVSRFVESEAIVSDSSRTELIEFAFSLFLNSYFCGTGIGSIQASLETLTSGITLPHNLFIEILVQYGLIIFFCFLSLLYFIFLNIRKTKDLVIRYVLCAALCSLPAMAVINSSYLLFPVIWIYFSSLFVFATLNK